jgi:hypothetical protein
MQPRCVADDGVMPARYFNTDAGAYLLFGHICRCLTKAQLHAAGIAILMYDNK